MANYCRWGQLSGLSVKRFLVGMLDWHLRLLILALQAFL